MYHIKHDKRAQASTELICAGLMACMKENPFAARQAGQGGVSILV